MELNVGFCNHRFASRYPRPQGFLLLAIAALLLPCILLAASPDSAQRWKIRSGVLVSENGGSVGAITLPFRVDDAAPVFFVPRAPLRTGATTDGTSKTAPRGTYLVGTREGIVCSPDGGKKWHRTLVASVPDARAFRDGETTGERHTLYYDANDPMGHPRSWKSRDNGMTWIPATGTETGNRTTPHSSTQPRFSQSLPFDIDWSEPVMISNPGEKSFQPVIALGGEDQRTIHLSWWQNDSLSYMKSTDGGETFGPEINPFPGDTTGGRQQIVVSGSRVILFFSNGVSASIPNSDLHMVLSNDSGTTWPYRGRIAPFKTSNVNSAYAVGDTLVLLFPPMDALPDYFALRLYVSVDGGETWQLRPSHLNGLSYVSPGRPGEIHMSTWGGGLRTAGPEKWRICVPPISA